MKLLNSKEQPNNANYFKLENKNLRESFRADLLEIWNKKKNLLIFYFDLVSDGEYEGEPKSFEEFLSRTKHLNDWKFKHVIHFFKTGNSNFYTTINI
jgi:hypothetical protein